MKNDQWNWKCRATRFDDTDASEIADAFPMTVVYIDEAGLRDVTGTIITTTINVSGDHTWIGLEGTLDVSVIPHSRSGDALRHRLTSYEQVPVTVAGKSDLDTFAIVLGNSPPTRSAGRLELTGPVEPDIDNSIRIWMSIDTHEGVRWHLRQTGGDMDSTRCGIPWIDRDSRVQLDPTTRIRHLCEPCSRDFTHQTFTLRKRATQ